MRSGSCLRSVAPLILMAFSQASAAALEMDKAVVGRLRTLHNGEQLAVDGFPIGPARNATVHFHRAQVYAPDARIYVISNKGREEIPRSQLTFLRGETQDRRARVALALNPDGSIAHGNGNGPEGAFVVDIRTAKDGAYALSARDLESTLPSPYAFDFRCGNENVDLNLHSAQANLANQLQRATSTISAPQATQSLRYALIGIDSDSLFMSRLFANNTTTATNWIASMFNTMNTMYETDLQVQLEIGTTILRTSSAGDPYTGLSTGSANTADLDLFGNYWRTNEASVTRSFAILLSGAIASSGGGCSAAGIAWIDEYCQKGIVLGSDTVGSYSVNKVCTSLAIDPNGTFDARIVGHELGHNFGAWHTHCTNTSTGVAPTGINTIDQCYNGESGSGCYSGATSCPAGQTAGTIMSYCNITGCGTQNQLQFHATQVNDVLLPLISANTPVCLSTIPDEIFKNGFGG